MTAAQPHDPLTATVDAGLRVLSGGLDQVVPVQPEPLPEGGLLDGRYRVGPLLGSGGMSDVHRAHDTLLDREVALKVFRGTRENHAGRQREMRLLARFSHPALVAVYDAGAVQEGPGAGRHYLVLELVPGATLAQTLRSGPLTAPLVARIGADIAGALAFVHEAGVVHRDVKPANILLPPGILDEPGAPGDPLTAPSARLADFGIARSTRDHPASTVDHRGTPGYLSPEQAMGAPLAPPSDVYALGLVLLESLSGERAFTGTPVQQAYARTRRAPAIPAALPERWRGLLSAMTALEPTARPSAARVEQELADL
ncbi:serine/threonine-protein kinase [Cellulomonas denverensis]|uniref:Serine/threonine protein kinase n=1 Tax=Cellulomonas denverensis TaxID=264297 RepID=A0A7X6QZG5_9CELL|nr:serine/threonine-protein kinase [Cellulomonas denverensis]NKY23168.1 serine/threonine protein kinase [Cellulomonas denverensis]